LESNEKSLHDFLEKHPCRIVETGDPGTLYDIDTMEDARIIKDMMGENIS
jgi:CTP:molybdopterin cytidylyltransferase MocA